MLSDPERRATYDRFGKAGLARGGFEPVFADFGSLSDVFAAFFGDDLLGGAGARQNRSRRGGDVQAVVEIELEEAFTGAAVSVPLDVALPCERCDSSGAEPGTSARTCPTCSGSGAVRSVSQNIFGQFVQQRACPECGGAGEVMEQPCADCGGEGRIVSRTQIEVDVPKGIHDGQQIRVRGEGHAGFRSPERGHAFVDRPRPAGSALRTRRRRSAHGAATHDDRGSARDDGDGVVARGRRRARRSGRHAAR